MTIVDALVTLVSLIVATRQMRALENIVHFGSYNNFCHDKVLKAFPFIHEAYPAAWKKFRHWSGVKRSQISPMASMS